MTLDEIQRDLERAKARWIELNTCPSCGQRVPISLPFDELVERDCAAVQAEIDEARKEREQGEMVS